MQGGKSTRCRLLSLIIGRAFSLGCLLSADQPRCAIRAKAVSGGQCGLEDGWAALGTRQQWRQEEWGAPCIRCTQHAQADLRAMGASGPWRHQCQTGKAICAGCSREGKQGLDNALCHRCPSLLQCLCSWAGGSLDPLPSSSTHPVLGGAGTRRVRGGDDPAFASPACIHVLLHF